MTKYLFHGDNQAGSRAVLQTLVAKEKSSGKEIIYLDGYKLAPRDLATSLASISLFAQDSLVIENLLSRPLSNDKKQALLLIKEYNGSKNLILWEKKEATKTQIKSLGEGVIAQVAKTPAVIFQLLDSLAPGRAKESLALLHKTLELAEEGFIFIMLSRHIADLLVAQSGDTSKLIPFKRSRLISQARLFSLDKLETFHLQLLSIDRAVKTGRTKLSYIDHLDLLLANLLN